jgi:hypothetical protein
MAKEMKNIRALTGFRLKGGHVGAGDVVAKSDFPSKGDWQNLVNMTPARAEETDDSAGPAPKAKGKSKGGPAAEPAMPGA